VGWSPRDSRSGDGMRSRGWIFTLWTDKIEERTGVPISNYLEDNLTESSTLVYAIGGHELTPKTGRKHVQGFLYFENGVTRGGFASRLGIEAGEYWADPQRGTHQRASEYAAKDGDIAINMGLIPEGDSLAVSAWDYILDMVKEGCTDAEIMQVYPAQYGRCSTGIAKMRMELLSEKINTWRDVTVTYVWGSTGAGKTRGILEGQVDHPSDVYRITDYDHPFDNYRGQKVLLLEEFRSSLPLEEMLIYLDGYYCELPCRYSNKVANWDRIFIVTNIPLIDNYKGMQRTQMESFAAFLRRIDAQMHMGHLEGNIVPLDSVKQQLERLGVATTNYDPHQEVYPR